MQRRYLLGVILVIGGVAWMMSATTPTTADTATARFGDTTLRLAVADEPGEWRTGLMNREELPEDGMVFVFPREQEQVFWMKNTSIPLDIIFIAANNSVMRVASADPQPGVADNQLQRYTGVARYVVETRQGFADTHDIDAGDRAVLDLPGT